MMIALTFITGIAAGILSGLLGIGGGMVLVPMMVFGLGLSQHAAQGISLLVIIPTAVAGVWQLRKENLIDYKVAGYLALGAIMGALITSSFVQYIPGSILKKVFGIFVIIMGIRMIMAKKKQAKQ